MKLKLKDYKYVIVVMFLYLNLYSQNNISGKVISNTGLPLPNVKIYTATGNKLAHTNKTGQYSFTTLKDKLTLLFFADGFELFEKEILISSDYQLNVKLKALSEALSEVEIKAQKRKVFQLARLKDVKETAIYAGKKTEVVLVDQSVAALASNNARQIYSQIAGLNIFQNDDAGLQLNIGGRGLDPNRTSNFNTRQNGYDISADVLGYPESYYTPPAEALEEIQVVRGAASLQYGTQFGGLVNFVIKKPIKHKAFGFLTRNTLGSNGLFTSFTSVSGTANKFSYLFNYNYKQGNGFRPNSKFNSKNIFSYLGYQLATNTKVETEFTYLNYLAQQAGGLTTGMFYKNPLQSNRERNWFTVNWLLYNLKFSHRFSKKTNFTFNFFGLNASRKALGFRNRRVYVSDDGKARDLIKGEFNNFGFESRLLGNYNILSNKAIYLVGAKFYKAKNSSVQGPGTDGKSADFSSALSRFPYYQNQSNYQNPNTNVAVFGENILYLTNKFSITPGVRFEYIKTGSRGFLKKTNLDGAGNPLDQITINNEFTDIRNFVLLGVGASYKPVNNFELYGNISQNYRSITFSDINIVNPVHAINPDMQDEKGYTSDLGFRGNYKRIVSFDVGLFALLYKNKIGSYNKVIKGEYKKYRTNVGNARVLGFESILDFNLKKVLKLNRHYIFNYFANTSFINPVYTSVNDKQLNTTDLKVGNTIEFVPELNFKTGVKFGYKNFLASLQYTYLSDQFTDAENSVSIDTEGVRGTIPAYDVLDFSSSYKFKYFKLEGGVNNLLDKSYFTRRATGYPGPGIIPSSPINWYLTVQFKL